jgi:hypothetical protein
MLKLPSAGSGLAFSEPHAMTKTIEKPRAKRVGNFILRTSRLVDQRATHIKDAVHQKSPEARLVTFRKSN